MADWFVITVMVTLLMDPSIVGAILVVVSFVVVSAL